MLLLLLSCTVNSQIVKTLPPYTLFKRLALTIVPVFTNAYDIVSQDYVMSQFSNLRDDFEKKNPGDDIHERYLLFKHREFHKMYDKTGETSISIDY